MKIKKMFTQVYCSFDMEHRYWDWYDSNDDYEEMKEELKKKDTCEHGVRVVEKIFDEDTFTIEERIIKEASAVFDEHYNRVGAIKETIY